MADWDEIAESFDEAFFADPMYSLILAAMVKKARDGKVERALDLGCGTGNLIAMLLEEFPAAEMIGVDPSAGMRGMSEERFRSHPNVEIMGGDALDIPLEDGSVDLIVTSLALHHVSLDLKPSCAREMARVLKPGGRFIHADPFCGVAGAADDAERWRDIIERMVAKALYSLEHGAWKMMLGELKAITPVLRGEGEYMITVEEWEVLLQDAGFSNFEVFDIPPVDLIKIVSCRLD